MAKTFIDLYMDYTEPLESPDSFLKWSAYATIAATMRDYFRLYKPPQRYVYPNIYVILYAKSSGVRKGPPLKVASSLLTKIGNTKVIPGRGSLEAVVGELATVETSKAGITLKGASGIIYSEELAAFIPRGSEQSAVNLLTDLYDFHDNWKNTLKSTGVDHLSNVCLTLLAASNDKLFNQIYGAEAISGGLLARTFLIAETRRRKLNPGVYDDPNKYDPKALLDHLKHIVAVGAAGQGQTDLIYAPSAAELYHRWYLDYNENEHKFDENGVMARLPTGVEKMAMILAMSELDFDRLIEKRHVEEAIDICLSLLKNYERIVMGQGRSEIAEAASLVIKELLDHEDQCYSVSRKQLLRKYYQIDADELDKVVKTLLENEYLTTVSVKGDVGYQLTTAFLRDWENDKGKSKTV